jgi:hypothetical protein
MTVNELHKITESLIAQGNGEFDVVGTASAQSMSWDTTNIDLELVTLEKQKSEIHWCYPSHYSKAENKIEGVPFIYINVN